MRSHRIQLVQRFACALGSASLAELLLQVQYGFRVGGQAAHLSFAGTLVELPGLLWFLAFITLESGSIDKADDSAQRRKNLHLFAWSIIGFGMGLWALMNAPHASRTTWQYIVALSCLLATFLSAGLNDLPRVASAIPHIVPDMRRYASSKWALGCFALLLSIGAIAPTASDLPLRVSQPPLTGQALIEWFDAQPRRDLVASYRIAPVTVATIVDYQCPSCQFASRTLGPIFDELTAQFGGALGFVSLDFPLERECNSGDIANLHSLACEAAAALRTMPGPSARYAFVEWLWSNQADLSERALFRQAMATAQRDKASFDKLYQEAMQAVRAEAALVHGLGIRSTPQYWINGVVTPRRLPEDMRLLILHELARSGYSPLNR